MGIVTGRSAAWAEARLTIERPMDCGRHWRRWCFPRLRHCHGASKFVSATARQTRTMAVDGKSHELRGERILFMKNPNETKPVARRQQSSFPQGKTGSGKDRHR